ncbi:hypothetical protein GCM10010206_66640 [Streptomyces cinerochromogenes]|nr:hypothetical protein GCM10010206_66640 [Streptomyces cinerochromogenes]
MVPDDVDLPLGPACAGGGTGCQDLDAEVVVPCERDRIRVQRNGIRTFGIPAWARILPSSPRSACAWAPGMNLEPAVRTRQFIGNDADLFRDPGPGFVQVELHTLVVASGSVLLDQPFMDDGTLGRGFRP